MVGLVAGGDEAADVLMAGADIGEQAGIELMQLPPCVVKLPQPDQAVPAVVNHLAKHVWPPDRLAARGAAILVIIQIWWYNFQISAARLAEGQELQFRQRIIYGEERNGHFTNEK